MRQPHGQPALLIHGGPGGGSNTTMRRFHDPRHYRIVLFDQRGCGRSTPNASLEENTTWHLVADMERLREHLGIARWQLFGGSWGSTLALAYAEKHPERVSALVLRGIFLLRRRELEWFYEEGCSWLFPDAYEAYAPHPAGRARRHHRRLLQAAARPRSEGAARGRARLERMGGHHAVADRGQRAHQLFATESYALAFARIECHYFVNRGFFDGDDQLLRERAPARRDPGHHRAWPLRRGHAAEERLGPEEGMAACGLRIVPDAGHAMTELGIVHELVAATRAYARPARLSSLRAACPASPVRPAASCGRGICG